MAADWSALAVWAIALSAFGYYVVTFGSFAGNYGAGWAAGLSLLWIALFVMLHLAMPLRSRSTHQAMAPENPEPPPQQHPPLTDAVADALADDAAQEGVLNAIPPVPSGHDRGRLTELERDVADWGYTYGVAWAGVRARYPEDSPEEVARRALAIAQQVFADYMGNDDWPERMARERRELQWAVQESNLQPWD